MRKFIIFLLIFALRVSFCEEPIERYSAYIEKGLLKEYKFSKYKIFISNLLPFLVKIEERKIILGCFWTGQGAKKEGEKINFTHEGWQFSDFGGKIKGDIISENPLKFKIDTREIAKKENYPIGFIEEMEIVGNTINVNYEFEVNKNTDYGVRIYISFLFNPDIIDKEVSPYIDDEKAIYETKDGGIIISYSNFKPDRFQMDLWKSFRVFLSFPEGLKNGEKRTGKITITLP